MCYSMTPNIYRTYKVMYVTCVSNFILIILLLKAAMRFNGKFKEEESQLNNPKV